MQIQNKWNDSVKHKPQTKKNKSQLKKKILFYSNKSNRSHRKCVHASRQLFYSGNRHLQQYCNFHIFWSQSPPNSTGRDKCNTIQKHSIATNPNLCRKGFDFPLLLYRLFTTTVSFAWICTAEYYTAGCKLAKLTIEQCSVTGQLDGRWAERARLELYSWQYCKCS